MKKISIVIPCYNEAKNLEELYARITNSLDSQKYEREIIFVDNASTDNSEQIYNNLTNDPTVTVLVMSRNFGTSQTSFFAGLKAATGDAVILIESDLQDPPELISQLIEKWEEGFDVVYAVRKKRHGTPIRKLFYKCFYYIFKWLSYLQIPLDAGDFSLLDRKVVDVIKKLPEKDVYIRGLRAWAGFKQTGITYIRDARAHGKTSIRFLDNFAWAKKAIINFSYKPLEFISKLTIIASFVTVGAAGFYLYLYFKTTMPRGFPTLLMVMFIFGTIQLLSLSIIGEYLIRMFKEIKGRPPYVIAKTLHRNALHQKDFCPNSFLVTGGNGFIGTNIVHTLVENGQNVVVLTEQAPDLWIKSIYGEIADKITIVECDITNKEKLSQLITQIRPTNIFHLAALGMWIKSTRSQPGKSKLDRLLNVNLHGTINLLEACKQVDFECFINTGTASEYGHKSASLSESMSLEPIDDYSMTKAMTTLYCQKEAISHSLPIYTVRPFCVYGRFEPSHRLIPTILQNHFAKKEIHLSSPDSVRDFIYVQDVADFYIHLAKWIKSTNRPKPEKHIFNIGTGVQTSIGDVVHELENILGETLKVSWNTQESRPWEFKNWQADTNRTQKILDWKPKHNLNSGLRKTVEHYVRTSRIH